MLLSELKGVGKKTVALFEKLNIHTVEDLLEHYPMRYEEYPAPQKIGDIQEGKSAICCVVNMPVSTGKNGSRRLVIYDGTGTIVITWFNNPYVQYFVKRGQEYVFLGNVSKYNGKLYMAQPTVKPADEYRAIEGSLTPVYHLTAGLTNDKVFKLILQAISSMDEPVDMLPESVRQKYNLISRGDAIRCIHYPSAQWVLDMAHHRIVFDEFYSLLSAIRQGQGKKETNQYKINNAPSVNMIRDILPYKLTASQETAVSDILLDFAGDYGSDRLIQGDVGSGKTIVAVMCMAAMADNGYQSVLMAPTEVLARQHYDEINSIIEKIGKMEEFYPVLLTGSMSESEKKQTRESIASGKSRIIVGTHAVIQNKVIYKSLALAITDEQHRFGVEQRASLLAKSNGKAHNILMTATPIPRTTAQILFGGMEITKMKDKPADRLPIITKQYMPNDCTLAYSFAKQEIDKGHQVYIICPMVDDGADDRKSVEGYEKTLKKHFPQIPYGLLYGRMEAKEKQKIMEKFASEEIKILVSTTVVEVGINVPNATVILLENAEMFGLLQLHQLRGRVGRGDAQSYCLLLPTSEVVDEKLDILCRTNDGFEIAEADYRLRKAGQLLGTRQSGDMGFKLADIAVDEKILMEADETLLTYI